MGHGDERERELDTREMMMWNPNKSSREYEADEFAAELLMPEEKFREVWKATEDISTAQVFFDVTISAVKKRMDRLGIKYV